MTLPRMRKTAGKASSLMALLVIFAVLLSSVIPAGFMPAFDKEGFTQIVICSGTGQKTITVPSDDVPPTDHQEGAAAKICAYQILAFGKATLPPPIAIIPAPAVIDVSAGIAQDADMASAVFLPFAARGPPIA